MSNNNAIKFLTTKDFYVMVSNETSDWSMLLPEGSVLDGPVRMNSAADMVFFTLSDGQSVGALNSQVWPAVVAFTEVPKPTCCMCHEQDVLTAGDVCSCCWGGEN